MLHLFMFLPFGVPSMPIDEQLKQKIDQLADKKKSLIDEFEQTKVNVALIGEPGVGKSSLINAIVGKKVAETGATGETTRTAQAVHHDEVEGLIFWDLPGCGTPNHPRETFIEDQMLLTNYDVFVLVTEKRIRQGDEWLYRKLRTEAGKPIFVVRTHFDQVVDELDENEARRRIAEDIQKQLGEGASLRVYLVALKGPKTYDLGLLIEGLVDSLDGLKHDRAALAVAPLTEELLRKKRHSAEKIVSNYALLGAANAFNPIPGLDVSVDLGVLSYMASKVVAAYGLTDAQLDHTMRRKIPAATMKAIRTLVKPVTEYLAREGVLLILRRVGSDIARRSAAKWVPLVGQAVASYLGYKLTIGFGMNLIDDCEAAVRGVAQVLQVEES
jgi:small GTP-binding protein